MRQIIPVSEHQNIKKYLDQGLSHREVGAKYGVDKCCIFAIAKKNGFKSLLSPGRRRKYSLNQSFFKIIDTPNKAYFLGLLCADGYISGNKNKSSITINLQEKDKEILEKFKIELETDTNLFFKNYSNRGWSNQYSLSVTSKEMINDLIKLGCTPRKSLTLKFPTSEQVPPDLIRHFIRGYFDGDGGICFCNGQGKRTPQVSIGIACSHNFALTLKDLLKEKLNWDFFIIQNDKISSLRIGGRNKVFTFLKWLYENCDMFLERKKNKYIELQNFFLERDVHKRDKFFSKYFGVSYIKRKQRFCASIRHNNKMIRIGSGYKTEIEAAKAYDKKSIELFGEKAKTNLPISFYEIL